MENHPQTSAAVVQGAGNVTFNNSSLIVQAVATAENHKGIIPSENEEARKSRNADHHQLSEFIWIFQDKPLGKRGNVFEGEMRSDVCNPRIAAIKYIPLNEKNVKEAKILEKLNPHPHVVAILHSNTVPGPMNYLYIAMERCHTQTLQDFISDRKKQGIPFNFSLISKYTKQLIDGMRHIHKNKIIHRDVKPENILFSFDMQSMKISDFGLSKELKSGRSVTNQSTLRVGTDGYRAPETYNEDVISLKADIFSLALVLYFLWSYGLHPFGNEPDLWNFNIKNNQNRDLKSLLIPQISAAIDLLERMLNFKPSLRPTIEEVFQDPCVINLTAAITRDATSDAPTYKQVGQQASTSRDWQTRGGEEQQQQLISQAEAGKLEQVGQQASTSRDGQTQEPRSSERPPATAEHGDTFIDYHCDETFDLPPCDEEEALVPNIGDLRKFSEIMEKRTLDGKEDTSGKSERDRDHPSPSQEKYRANKHSEFDQRFQNRGRAQDPWRNPQVYSNPNIIPPSRSVNPGAGQLGGGGRRNQPPLSRMDGHGRQGKPYRGSGSAHIPSRFTKSGSRGHSRDEERMGQTSDSNSMHVSYPANQSKAERQQRMPRSSGGRWPPTPSGEFAHHSPTQMGKNCHTKVRNGITYEGIFHTFSPKMDLALSAVHMSDNSDQAASTNGIEAIANDFPKEEELIQEMVFPTENLVSASFEDVDLNFAALDVNETNGESMSQQRSSAKAGEKKLEPWNGGGDTLGPDLLAEMFKAHRKKYYGALPNYHASLSSYTMPLEIKVTEEGSEIVARATRIAQEIEAGNDYKNCINLEPDDGVSEEDKFIAVTRDREPRRDGRGPRDMRDRDGEYGGHRGDKDRGNRDHPSPSQGQYRGNKHSDFEQRFRNNRGRARDPWRNPQGYSNPNIPPSRSVGPGTGQSRGGGGGPPGQGRQSKTYRGAGSAHLPPRFTKSGSGGHSRDEERMRPPSDSSRAPGVPDSWASAVIRGNQKTHNMVTVATDMKQPHVGHISPSGLAQQPSGSNKIQFVGAPPNVSLSWTPSPASRYAQQDSKLAAPSQAQPISASRNEGQSSIKEYQELRNSFKLSTNLNKDQPPMSNKTQQRHQPNVRQQQPSPATPRPQPPYPNPKAQQ